MFRFPILRKAAAFALFAANITVSMPAHGLEMTAVSKDEATKYGIRIQALEAQVSAALTSMTATIAALRDSIADCSEQGMFYGPGRTGADANGCIAGAASGGVPANTIAAFNLTTCPTGWTPYTAANGRFLVGYGTADGRTYTTIGGTTDTAGKGGEAMHTLTVAEMPAHTHTYSRAKASLTDVENDTEIDMVKSISQQTVATSSAGGGDEHETRPPFTIVLWCRKL